MHMGSVRSGFIHSSTFLLIIFFSFIFVVIFYLVYFWFLIFPLLYFFSFSSLFLLPEQITSIYRNRGLS